MQQEEQHYMSEPMQWSDHLIKWTVLPLIPKSLRPNHVTVFRIIATPFVLFLLALGEYSISIPVFLGVAFTDAIDGAMARVRSQVTHWGKVWDPIADKLLIGSVVIVFVVRELSVELGLVILAIEALFIIAAWWQLRHGKRVQANMWGKIKMNLEVLGVVVLLIAVAVNLPALVPISAWVFYLAITFAIVSLVTYGI